MTTAYGPEHRVSERGATLTEFVIVAGILGIVLAAASYSFRLIESVDGHLTVKDDVSSIRYLLMRQMDCDATRYPDGFIADACTDQPPLAANETCEARPKLAVYARIGASPREFIPKAGRSVGPYQLRAWCPAGQPRVEVRPVKSSGGAAKDKLTGRELAWAPLLAAPLCSRLPDAPIGEIVTVRADVVAGTPVANCPGHFRNVPSLTGPETILHFFDATPNCPPGTRLVGGGGDCRYMGLMPLYTLRSAVVDAHPQLASSPSGKLADATAFRVTCCGSIGNFAPKADRAFAFCEKL
jgi:hypothetical protein